jgi:HEAT repeat protein
VSWEQLALEQPGGWDAVLRVRGLSPVRLRELTDVIAGEPDPLVRYGWARFAQQQQDIPMAAIQVLLTDKDRLVRRASLAAVVWRQVQTGNDDSLVALTDALTTPNLAVAAAEVLGLVGDPRAVPELLAAFRTRDVVMGAAIADALGKCGDVVALPWLLAAVRHRFCSAACLVALGTLADNRSRTIIIDSLGDDDDTVRAAACRALSLLAPEPAPLALRALLLDPIASVRLAAALALYQLHERATLASWR